MASTAFHCWSKIYRPNNKTIYIPNGNVFIGQTPEILQNEKMNGFDFTQKISRPW